MNKKTFNRNQVRFGWVIAIMASRGRMPKTVNGKPLRELPDNFNIKKQFNLSTLEIMSACIDIEETCGVTINKEDLPMFFTIGGIKQWLINNGYAPQPKVEDETVTVEETLTEEVSIEAEVTEETIVPDTVKLTPSVEEEPIEATAVITESLVSYEKVPAVETTPKEDKCEDFATRIIFDPMLLDEVPVEERTATVFVPVGMTEEA